MPEIINCPSCQRQLRLPEELMGQSVQCPDCGHQFVAQTSLSEPPQPPAGATDITEKMPRYDPSPPPPPTGKDYDDDYDRYDEPYVDEPRRRRFRRRDLEPHRGGLILGLGIGGIVTGLCCGVFGLILPIVAIVLANIDLKAIKEGRMDPDGEGQTRAGRTCGIVALILWFVMIVVMLAINLIPLFLDQRGF